MALDDFERLLISRHVATDADNAVVEKQIAKMYKDAYKSVDAEIAKLFATLGADSSLLEAQKYNRLRNLKDSIASEYQKMMGKVIALAVDTSAQNFTEAFYGYNWAMDQSVGATLKFGVLPIEAIRASVFSEYSGLSIIKTFLKNKTQELTTIQAALTRGIATGAGYAKTAREIKDKFVRGYNSSLRIVRTESTRNYTEGHNTAYDKAREIGIDVVNVWRATLDGRTRDAHGMLDGVEADKDGNFRSANGGFGKGPGLMGNASDDINERCRLVGQIKGVPPEYRRIKGEGVQPYEKWEPWALKKGWTPEKGWPKTKLV